MNSREPTDEELEAWHLSQIHQRPSPYQAKSIRTVMKKLMAKRGYSAIQANDSLQSVWASLVGSELAKLSRPGNISRGILQVSVSDHGAMNELHFQLKQIVAGLQAQLPESKIKNVRLRIGATVRDNQNSNDESA
jgi:predicted nucleic acid-binding Zn ribbon protein